MSQYLNNQILMSVLIILCSVNYAHAVKAKFNNGPTITAISKKTNLKILDYDVSLPEYEIRLPKLGKKLGTRELDNAIAFVKNDEFFLQLLDSLIEIKQHKGFNDWVVFITAKKLVSNFNAPYAEQQLLLFLIAHNLGLKSVISYRQHSKQDIHVWVALEQEYHGRSLSYVGESDKYYALTEENIAKKAYQYGSRPSLKLRKNLRALNPYKGIKEYVAANRVNTGERVISTYYQDQKFKITLKFNQVLTSYLDTLPSLVVNKDNASLLMMTDNTFMQSFLTSFNQITAGKSDQTKLNILLAFTGKGFEYKVDHEVWGRERSIPSMLMLDKVIKYSDCEDRAILFATLANLAGFDTALITLPGHIMAGIKLNTNLAGYQFEDYYAAEATSSSGATIGYLSKKHIGADASVFAVNSGVNL